MKNNLFPFKRKLLLKYKDILPKIVFLKSFLYEIPKLNICSQAKNK